MLAVLIFSWQENFRENKIKNSLKSLYHIHIYMYFLTFLNSCPDAKENNVL